MLRRLSILKYALVAFLFLGAVACSSSDSADSDDGDDAATTEEDVAEEFAMQAVNSATTGISAVDSISDTPPTLRFIVSSFDCDSGTIDIDTDTYEFTYNDCAFTDGDTTVTTSGTFTMSVVGDTLTMEMDLTVVSEDATDTVTISMSGSISISIDVDEATIVYDDLSATYDDGGVEVTVTVDGTLTYDIAAGTLDGDFVVTANGTTVTCTFTDFDFETATESDYDDACVTS